VKQVAEGWLLFPYSLSSTLVSKAIYETYSYKVKARLAISCFASATKSSIDMAP
jgi:hypothetical protein